MPTLTAPRRTRWRRSSTAIAAGDPTPFLLDGPTGAGKTAVYAEAIAASLAAGRPALVLVPEIALALPLVDRLRADLDGAVAVVHSALGDGERADAWRRIRAGDVDVVVGTRIAILAPLADVGLVVVDEEHEATYKSDRTPRLQARDAAVRARPPRRRRGRPRERDARRSRRRARARRAGTGASPCPTGRRAPPAYELVDLRAELAAGNRGLLLGAARRGARRRSTGAPGSGRSS